MPSPTAPLELTRKGRKGFLKKPTTTTISLEEDLLGRVQRDAAAQSQSVSQWVTDAAKRKLKGSRRALRETRQQN